VPTEFEGEFDALIEELLKADVLVFEVLSAIYTDVPLSLSGVISGPFIGVLNRCAKKVPGELRFTLNSVRHLGLPTELDFEFDLHGSVETHTKSGKRLERPIIHWEASQQVRRTFTVNGQDLYVLEVEGVLRTALYGEWFRQPSFIDYTACTDGGLRQFATTIYADAEAPSNTLKVAVRLDGNVDAVLLRPVNILALCGRPLAAEMDAAASFVEILTPGARVGGSGLGLRPGRIPIPIPPGPLPVERALRDVALSLVLTKAAYGLSDHQARQVIQVAAVQAAKQRLNDILSPDS